ncbi:HEPN domain-containing protein [Pinirhizobacter soli]|uniref:HEPN domain-containing protein n=1 Tax=Pinirhizobacter soli TaxID=2786953 RepID=UPI002029C2A0|nr:HEPN domain-containing protein [Pinirhizobacter soli]
MADRRQITMQINNFAERCFRDTADGDYLTARLAFCSGLVAQFLWSSQQALEKYLKYILLVNRVPAAAVGHDLLKALDLAKTVRFPPTFTSNSMEFFRHIAKCGVDRYLEFSFDIVGWPLHELDQTVWELRRYCQILHGGMDVSTEREHLHYLHLQSMLAASDVAKARDFRICQGRLEKILDAPTHRSKSALLWKNAVYGDSPAPTADGDLFLEMVNSPLYLYPEMLDELVGLIKINPRSREAWQQHRDSVRRGFTP